MPKLWIRATNRLPRRFFQVLSQCSRSTLWKWLSSDKTLHNGFTKLRGFDPFIDESHDYGRIKIFKKEIHDLNGSFDLIMIHHAPDGSLLS
ncbi:MAG TPA: hypothetical protein VFH08_11350 [Chitinophagaceae bacterium]|nr:hypothetical protein [Chitinophagaceae bacterium]